MDLNHRHTDFQSETKPRSRNRNPAIRFYRIPGRPTTADHTEFGNVSVDGGTLTRTFTVQNFGSQDLDLTNSPPLVRIIGTHAADFTLTLDASTPIAVGGPATTFQVTFDPDGIGLRQARIRIKSNDVDEPTYNFAVQGTGSVPEMDVQGNAISIADGDTIPSTTDHTDFEDVALDGVSIIRTFTILNTGSAELSLTESPRVSMGGAQAADFTLTIDATSPVPPAGQTTFQVTFDPSAVGLREATISIANNDADENPYTFSIQGTGITSIYLPIIQNN